jgi:hypothetical protein
MNNNCTGDGSCFLGLQCHKRQGVHKYHLAYCPSNCNEGCILYKCRDCNVYLPKIILNSNNQMCINCAADDYARQTPSPP